MRQTLSLCSHTSHSAFHACLAPHFPLRTHKPVCFPKTKTWKTHSFPKLASEGLQKGSTCSWVIPDTWNRKQHIHSPTLASECPLYTATHCWRGWPQSNTHNPCSQETRLGGRSHVRKKQASVLGIVTLVTVWLLSQGAKRGVHPVWTKRATELNAALSLDTQDSCWLSITMKTAPNQGWGARYEPLIVLLQSCPFQFSVQCVAQLWSNSHRYCPL